MRRSLTIFGALAFLGGALVIVGSKTVFQEIEGCLSILVATVSVGLAAVIAAIDKLREATIKIHDIERIERVQRDLTSGNPEVVARAREAAGAAK